MKILMESTCEIVAIQSIPCRKWIIETIDGVKPDMESFVYTRMLAIDPDMIIEDLNVYLFDGPNPPDINEVDLFDSID